MTEAEEFEFRLRLDQEAAAGMAPQSALMTQAPAPQTREQRLKSMPASEFWAGLPISRVAQGVASPLLAGAQLLGGEGVREKIAALEAAKQRGMEARGEGGTDWLGMAGQLAPAGAIASGITKALPAATSLLGRMGTGAAVGGGIAATTPTSQGAPEDFWSNKALQTGAGAVLGGTIPAAIEGAKAVGGVAKRVVEPLYEKGRDAVLKRYRIEELLGGDLSARDKVVNQLMQAKALVPGSKPTAGEAIADIPEATGLAAHQRSVSRMEGVSPEFAKRSAEQEGARQAAIGGIAQTPQAMEAAIQARATTTKPLREAALAAANVPIGVSPAPLLGNISKLANQPGLRGSDVVTKTLTDVKEKIRELSKATGSIDANDLYTIRKEAGNLIKKYAEETKNFDQRLTAGLLDKVQGYIDNAIEASGGTGWKAYLAKYAEMSQPINRMEVGQELQKALTAPLGTSERAAGFGTAMREAPRTLKKATGQPRYQELGEVLTPQETSSAQAVAQDLARKDAYQRLAAKTRVSGGDVIPGNVGVALPNLLSRPAMVANFLMKQAGRSAEDLIARKAGQQYLHPQALAAALKDVQTPQRQAIINAIMRKAGIPATVGAARQF